MKLTNLSVPFSFSKEHSVYIYFDVNINKQQQQQKQCFSWSNASRACINNPLHEDLPACLSICLSLPACLSLPLPVYLSVLRSVVVLVVSDSDEYSSRCFLRCYRPKHLIEIKTKWGLKQTEADLFQTDSCLKLFLFFFLSVNAADNKQRDKNMTAIKITIDP